MPYSVTLTDKEANAAVIALQDAYAALAPLAEDDADDALLDAIDRAQIALTIAISKGTPAT
jgi:hypothetical protein